MDGNDLLECPLLSRVVSHAHCQHTTGTLQYRLQILWRTLPRVPQAGKI
jgi:hypothetical protein